MAEGELHRAFGRICNAMGGIVGTVGADGTVEQVRGDADHPVSRGYTCPKGRAIPALHHDPRRLDVPLVGRGDDDPPFLPVKEGAPVVPERSPGPSAHPKHRQRVAGIKRCASSSLPSQPAEAGFAILSRGFNRQGFGD